MDKITIGIFGRINSGKSTLINSLAKEEISIVSSVRGSTSDSVCKTTEIGGVGRVVLIDTAGYDDEGVLAEKRILSVQKAFDSSDLALIVTINGLDEKDQVLIEKCKKNDKKYIVINNDFNCQQVLENKNAITLNVQNENQVKVLLEKISKEFSSENVDMFHGLVKKGDNVMLVMPQDEGAPNSRLILPQSIAIRQLVDVNACAIVTNFDEFLQKFNQFEKQISLVVTDSSVFDKVYNICGGRVALTSFSVLFAKYNGDIDYFVQSTKALDNLKDNSKVLLMESCSHTVSHKDIGEVVIPNLIKKYTGKKIVFEFLRGKNEPLNYADYDLVVHCGGCMQSKALMMSRVNKCKQNGVPMTNYGVLIAKIKGILDKIIY